MQCRRRCAEKQDKRTVAVAITNLSRQRCDREERFNGTRKNERLQIEVRNLLYKRLIIDSMEEIVTSSWEVR